MKKKTRIQKKRISAVHEEETKYETAPVADQWNPNKPFHGAQEEWWKYFHEIEKGNFSSLDSANQDFVKWKEQYLKNRLS